MAALLSPDWFDELALKLAAITPLGDAEHQLALGQMVEDGPFGVSAWTIHLGGGRASRLEHGVEHAEVTIIESFETMNALMSGSRTSELLYDGRLKISGNVQALLDCTELLARLNEALAE